MLFRKTGCLVVTENWVKLKMFSMLTIKWGQRGVKYFPLLFSLQTISEDALREKEREKEGLTDAQTNREREREIAPSNPQSRQSNRCPHPLHVTVSALFIPLRQKKTHPTPPTHSSSSPTQWTTHPWADPVNDPLLLPIPHRHIAPFVSISLSLSLKSLSHDWSWDFDFFLF